MHKRVYNLLKRIAPAIPVIMLAGACCGASLVLSSCRSSHSAVAVPQKPLRFKGVPTIRVRLTTQPQTSAEISTTGSYRILVDGRELDKSARRLAKTVLRRRDGRWRLGAINATGRRMVIIPTAAGFVRVGKRMYRGKLVLLADGPKKFFVHNHVNMESYIASVLAGELYPGFHPETYRAQAVAARTYALYEMATRGQRGSFDVWNSQRSQVYRGMLSETDKSWAAVRATHAWVLACGPAGAERIFLTQFSACNGGYVNGAEVLRDVKNLVEPLRGGQQDGDGKQCPHYTWKPVVISKVDLYRALADNYEKIRRLGDVEKLRLKSQTAYGRPIWVEVVNKSGRAVPVRADDIRLCLLRSGSPAAKKLYSMNCKFRDLGDAVEFYDGRGFGHGVGLSQWGAEEKAKRGKTAEEILEFYYPGSKIFRAY